MVLCSPFAPAVVIYIEHKILQRIAENRDDVTLQINNLASKNMKVILEKDNEYSRLMKQHNECRSKLTRYYRLEIALESVPQVVVKSIIILLAASEYSVPWASGLEAVFDTHTSASLFSTIVFYASTIWSFVGIANALLSTFLYWKNYTVGDLGKVIVYLRIFLGVSSKIFALLLATASFVGLFGLLTLHYTDVTHTYSQDVWNEYGDVLELSQQYDWYVAVSFGQFVGIFVVGMVLHVLVVGFMKRHSILSITKMKDVLPLLQHSSSTLVIPMIFKENCQF